MSNDISPGAPRALFEEALRRALTHGHLIDITTTGRVTGAPRRIEIVFHAFDGRIYISGLPRADRQRAWLRNLEADPRFTIHLRAIVQADVPAMARLITDPVERREVLEKVARAWRRTDVDFMVEHSPLVEAVVDLGAAREAA